MGPGLRFKQAALRVAASYHDIGSWLSGWSIKVNTVGPERTRPDEPGFSSDS
jgi:hypothetical protein